MVCDCSFNNFSGMFKMLVLIISHSFYYAATFSNSYIEPVSPKSNLFTRISNIRVEQEPLLTKMGVGSAYLRIGVFTGFFGHENKI